MICLRDRRRQPPAGRLVAEVCRRPRRRRRPRPAGRSAGANPMNQACGGWPSAFCAVPVLPATVRRGSAPGVPLPVATTVCIIWVSASAASAAMTAGSARSGVRRRSAPARSGRGRAPASTMYGAHDHAAVGDAGGDQRHLQRRHAHVELADRRQRGLRLVDAPPGSALGATGSGKSAHGSLKPNASAASSQRLRAERRGPSWRRRCCRSSRSACSTVTCRRRSTSRRRSCAGPRCCQRAAVNCARARAAASRRASCPLSKRRGRGDHLEDRARRVRVAASPGRAAAAAGPW